MTLPAFWAGRSAAERRLLAGGGIAVAAVLFLTFAWLPLERARARLEREVPELRASVAALRKDADEARRLRALPALTAASAASMAALASGSLAPPTGARLAATDERHLRLSAPDIGFTPLVQWLASTTAAQGLRVESARFEALPTPGRVRAEITFARP